LLPRGVLRIVAARLPMNAISFPKPDPTILARRDAIVAGLKAAVPGARVIDREDERRAFETDALTAYRKLPLAVVLPTTTDEVSAVPWPVRSTDSSQASGPLDRRVALLALPTAKRPCAPGPIPT